MKRAVLALSLVAGLFALSLVGVYASGVRVFVIQPIGAIPEGMTAIVTGSPGLRFVDSPDAFCQREQGYVNLICRSSVTGAVARNGEILARFPYFEWLYGLSGAPVVDR